MLCVYVVCVCVYLQICPGDGSINACPKGGLADVYVCVCVCKCVCVVCVCFVFVYVCVYVCVCVCVCCVCVHEMVV